MKISDREKKFLLIGGFAVFAVLIYYAYSMYADYKKRTADFSDARLVMLEKQLKRISGKDDVEKNLEEIRKALEVKEKAVLQGDKPPVAAAELSRLLREAASAQGVNIALERTLNPSDFSYYIAVPVEIGFTATTEKLKGILYSLKISPFLLTVPEIKIRVTNVTKPVDIYTTLVVTGYIKRPSEMATEDAEKETGADKSKGKVKEKTEEKEI
ncbi:MAG: hypothetical protein HZA16_02090 [Nitrospirae bacterium]|nr:hypothetical protein [Nitrospirota bacterium]